MDRLETREQGGDEKRHKPLYIPVWIDQKLSLKDKKPMAERTLHSSMDRLETRKFITFLTIDIVIYKIYNTYNE